MRPRLDYLPGLTLSSSLIQFAVFALGARSQITWAEVASRLRCSRSAAYRYIQAFRAEFPEKARHIFPDERPRNRRAVRMPTIRRALRIAPYAHEWASGACHREVQRKLNCSRATAFLVLQRCRDALPMAGAASFKGARHG